MSWPEKHHLDGPAPCWALHGHAVEPRRPQKGQTWQTWPLGKAVQTLPFFPFSEQVKIRMPVLTKGNRCTWFWGRGRRHACSILPLPVWGFWTTKVTHRFPSRNKPWGRRRQTTWWESWFFPNQENARRAQVLSAPPNTRGRWQGRGGQQRMRVDGSGQQGQQCTEVDRSLPPDADRRTPQCAW